LATGKRTAEWSSVGGCRALAYHPSGSRLAACAEDGTIFMWRVSDGELVAAFPTRGRRMLTAAFTPGDDAFVASGEYELLTRLETRRPDADCAARFNLTWAHRRILREGRRLNEDIEAALRRDDSLPPDV